MNYFDTPEGRKHLNRVVSERMDKMERNARQKERGRANETSKGKN